MQFRKPKKWNEPFRHDSCAPLAPKNRNYRNQQLEKKSVKKNQEFFFQKFSTAVRARPRDQDNPKKMGSYTHFLNPFSEPATNPLPNTRTHASKCSFSLRFRLVPNPNNLPVTA